MSANNSQTLLKPVWSEQHIILEFFDTSLRGCAQVMFQNNPVTGLFFFAAIFVGAYSEGVPAVAWGCLLGTLVATLTGYLTIKDRKSLRAGLYGYNGCLVGAALPTFLAATPIIWASIVLGSIVSVIVTVCIADILKTWKVAALTAPFVLTTWIILLASYSFAHIPGIDLPETVLPRQIDVHDLHAFLHSSADWMSIFSGISEVFLISNVVSGVLFLIGLAVESVWAALFALVGSSLALMTAIVLGANGHSIAIGMYSFSAVLTAIALGSTFNKPTLRVVIYTVIGVFFTVFTQGALNTALAPIGIPTLTMPFVLASWLFLVPNKEIMPEHRK
ncbi:urea transporter [Salmonella enterica]